MSAAGSPAAPATSRRRLTPGTRTVLVLAMTSLLTDVSSEMTLNVLPIYLAGTLGVSMATVGIIEGVAESVASLVRLFAGRLSDRLPRRLPVVIAGYGISALTKPLFAFASGAVPAGLLRFADRVGKGVRTPARDALLAGAAAEGKRGFAFGVHRAADSTGASLGVLSAALVIGIAGGELTVSTFRVVVLVAAVPALLAVAVLLLVREAPRAEVVPAGGSLFPPLGSASQRRFLLAIAIFAVGNSSDAFIVLRLIDLSATPAMALALLAVMHASHVLVAIPGGSLSDRVGRRRVLFGGYLAFALVYGGLGLVDSLSGAVVLLVLYGGYYGVTDGVSRAFLADLSPEPTRGGAYGWYHMAVGCGALPASVVAGTLWTQQGPAAAFLWGSVCAVLAMAVLATVPRREAVVAS
ncbi:MAG: MFS transporter [Dehalococcoidia bacterium]|nr:MFS transporter [Dehalococcoidia bacterium]